MGGYAAVREGVNHNLGCVHPGRGGTLQRTTGGKVIMFRYLKVCYDEALFGLRHSTSLWYHMASPGIVQAYGITWRALDELA